MFETFACFKRTHFRGRWRFCVWSEISPTLRFRNGRYIEHMCSIVTYRDNGPSHDIRRTSRKDGTAECLDLMCRAARQCPPLRNMTRKRGTHQRIPKTDHEMLFGLRKTGRLRLLQIREDHHIQHYHCERRWPFAIFIDSLLDPFSCAS